ncbi:hypothetical protein GCT13_37905 [Paraburkholderia sp. CNPSo 3157]|uniref:Uncharacterized protein n=1 Tax=Paraburkholderia franconis TaxID=2654983 RepID=A0A7X1NI86_9BURK|nr:hypothetical protein [Paraburkholderia franconis]MPW22450.1 hypothetical protein [Paraburkholderia franconis]
MRAKLNPGTQSHGEIVVMVDGQIAGHEIGNGTMNRVRSGGAFAENETPVLMVWDQIPLAAVAQKGKHDVGYRERFKALLQQLPARAIAASGSSRPRSFSRWPKRMHTAPACRSKARKAPSSRTAPASGRTRAAAMWTW